MTGSNASSGSASAEPMDETLTQFVAEIGGQRMWLHLVWCSRTYGHLTRERSQCRIAVKVAAS
jgi:hypothetical protein